LGLSGFEVLHTKLRSPCSKLDLMSSSIKLLPEVVHLIAAGEVIDSSSCCAGIGRKFPRCWGNTHRFPVALAVAVRVADNGCSMNRIDLQQQLPIALAKSAV